MPRYIPLDRLSRLTDHLFAETSNPRRSRRRDALAMLCGLQGLRVNEVCGLLRLDFDHACGTLHVETLKRGRPRDLPLSRRLTEALEEWSSTTAGTKWLFPTSTGERLHHTHLQRHCRRVTAAVLGGSFRFHSLRHTAGTALYNATHDLLLTGRALGHRDIKSTMVYAESLGNIRDHLLC